jgi:hypothetical protein
MSSTYKRAKKRSAPVKTKPVDLDCVQVWTPRQTCLVTGLKYRQLMRLIHANMVPHITCATERPAKSEKRIYLIPRVAFLQWLANIGPGGLAAQPGETVTITTTGETAA